MDINVSVWHYRVLMYMKNLYDCDREPESLCSYFWSFIWFVFMLPLICILFSPLLLSIVLVYFMIQGIGLGLARLSGNSSYTYEGSMAQVIVESIKGAKNKVCPLISYTYTKRD